MHLCRSPYSIGWLLTSTVGNEGRFSFEKIESRRHIQRNCCPWADACGLASFASAYRVMECTANLGQSTVKADETFNLDSGARDADLIHTLRWKITTSTLNKAPNVEAYRPQRECGRRCDETQPGWSSTTGVFISPGEFHWGLAVITYLGNCHHSNLARLAVSLMDGPLESKRDMRSHHCVDLDLLSNYL